MEGSGPSLSFTTGGDSETSYSNNSYFQKSIVDEASIPTKKAILNLLGKVVESKICVADLGCSSGPNTLSVVRNVVNIVEETCRELGMAMPEMQVYLNDLPGNDFNSVFSSLHRFQEKSENMRGSDFQSRFFPAGVAGSFHGRLFPSKSVHLFHCSSSLHWLSEDPLKTQEEREVIFNEGHIYISTDDPSSIRNLYARQFGRDLTNFLQSRSAEIVVGGKMVLSTMVRELEDTAQDQYSLFFNMISQELTNLVHEGLIEKDELDSFNLPIYFALPSEIEVQIDKEGSFQVEDQKIFVTRVDLLNKSLNKSRGQIVADLTQAAMGPYLGRHFGNDKMHVLFKRLSNAVDEDTSITEINFRSLVISLTSK